MAQVSAFDTVAADMGELFADYLEGDSSRPALVLSGRPCAGEVRDALDKSLASFGYAPPACTFASLTPIDAEAEGGNVELDAQALFMLVEGLDPLYVVAVDRKSAEALAQAFRCSLPLDAAARVFGRPAAVFDDLASNLATETGKQRAWKVLKTLGS